MLAKYPNKRNVIEFVSLDIMVPEDHLLRKIDAAIDYDKVYEFVEELYCGDNGRPSIDPVILFKIVLIQYIYGIPSLRRTSDEIIIYMLIARQKFFRRAQQRRIQRHPVGVRPAHHAPFIRTVNTP